MAADGFQFPAVHAARSRPPPRLPWDKVRAHVTPMEWRAQAPADRRDQPAEAREERRHPGPQLHDARDLPRRRRLRRRQPGPGRARPPSPTPRIIVQAGVHFMAETSKILSPDKTVLIPDLRAGCSLAELDHRRRRAADQAALSRPAGGHLRQHHRRGEGRDRHLLHQRQRRAGGRGSRAQWGVDRVILIPDEFLARNVARQTDIKIIAWQGRCEVHERFTAADILEIRAAYPRRRGAGPPGVPGRGAGGLRLRRLHRGDERLCDAAQAQAGGADHRVLDGRQRRRRRGGHRVRAPLQPLPAHEADHAWRTSTRPCCTTATR